MLQLKVIEMPVQFIKRGNNIRSNQSSVQKMFVAVYAVIQDFFFFFVFVVFPATWKWSIDLFGTFEKNKFIFS